MLRSPRLPRAAHLTLALALASPLLLLSAAGCGGAQSPASTPSSGASRSPGSSPTAPAASSPTSPPTADEARAFVDQVEARLRELWTARDRAGWIATTYITDDTEALAAAGEQATAEYVTRKVHEARRFDGLALPDDLARQMKLLRLSQIVPAPSDPKKSAELASIETAMNAYYGKATYCPPASSKLHPLLKKGESCMHLEQLEKVLSTSRDPSMLVEAWKGWHDTARSQRERFVKYVEGGGAQKDKKKALADVFWALLNSSEFMLNH
jgi:peptidyl-dipeptidase A